MLGFKNCAPACVPVWQREARLLACLVINVKATWECLPLVWTMWSHVSFFPPFILWTLSLIHSRGADWLSAVWVQRGTVFISLAFCCLWSVSCWLRVNTQHLITSPGFCLKGHWEPVCTHREGAGNDGEACWIQFKGRWLPDCLQYAAILGFKINTQDLLSTHLWMCKGFLACTEVKIQRHVSHDCTDIFNE